MLDVSRHAAEAAAALWAERTNRNERPDVGDVLIAGTAEVEGVPLLTADAGLLELVPGAELLRPSSSDGRTSVDRDTDESTGG